MKKKKNSRLDDKQKAMDTAWRLLTYRSRSKKELVDHLKRKKHAEPTIKHVSQRLDELGYIDDTKFAANWANYRKSQGKGTELIKAELRQKGINPQIINETIASLYKSVDEEIEQIKELALKKLDKLKKLPAQTVSRRLIGFLASRGFPMERIFEAIKEIK